MQLQEENTSFKHEIHSENEGAKRGAILFFNRLFWQRKFSGENMLPSIKQHSIKLIYGIVDRL